MRLKKAFIMGAVMIVLGWMFPSGVTAASPPPQSQGWEYAVQADDWLSKLAEKYLGDAHLWPRIVEATNTRAVADSRLVRIENPNVIYPGQIIFIPAASPALPASVKPENPSLGILCEDQHPVVQAFCAEIPIAQIRLDPYEGTELFSCASRAGLRGVQVDPNGVTMLVPNDGDFDLNGIVASMKVTPDKSSLIPRWPDSKFDFSAEYAQQFKLPAGEQLEIPLTKAFELIRVGELTWTGKHGEPGKAGLFQTSPPLTCDPQADFEIVIGPL